MASSTDSLAVKSDRSATSLSSSTIRDGTVWKAGRRYLDDAECPGVYPLPIDLAETHRQEMLTQLGQMVFGAPFLSTSLLENPPRRVLDLGCDAGFWSVLCHQYFSGQLGKGEGGGQEGLEGGQQQHKMSFVGIDVKPPPADVDECYRALGMDWEYIQHDLGETPWPVADEYFDVVMAKDLALALDGRAYSNIVCEYTRVLKPGGILEIWEHDYILRNLTPKIQGQNIMAQPDAAVVGGQLDRMGVYSADNSSLLRPATNAYAVEYNNWITTGLAARQLPAVPCSFISAMLGAGLVEGTEKLGRMVSRRIAVPLAGLVSWEQGAGDKAPRVLSDEQKAVRKTALDAFVGMVEAFEPVLREASGKDQAEWDAWSAKAKRNWLQEGGFAFGEFLELAAWSMMKEGSA